jgi:hypothetical protein
MYILTYFYVDCKCGLQCVNYFLCSLHSFLLLNTFLKCSWKLAWIWRHAALTHTSCIFQVDYTYVVVFDFWKCRINNVSCLKNTTYCTELKVDMGFFSAHGRQFCSKYTSKLYTIISLYVVTVRNFWLFTLLIFIFSIILMLFVLQVETDNYLGNTVLKVLVSQ